MIAPAEIAEVFYSADRLTGDNLRAFKGRGILPRALTEPDPVLRARVATSKGRVFDIVAPEEPGRLTFLTLARDMLGQPQDIVAWRPDSADTWTWLRSACVLGEDELPQPRLTSPALPVWRSPIAWLKAERRGIVILDCTRAAGLLADFAPLQGEDTDHCARLRLTLARPSPRIITPRKVHA